MARASKRFEEIALFSYQTLEPISRSSRWKETEVQLRFCACRRIAAAYLGRLFLVRPSAGVQISNVDEIAAATVLETSPKLPHNYYP
jgi:hypothetical protein